MSHRKAIPAKGTSVKASETNAVFPWSRVAALGPVKSGGRASPINRMEAVNNAAKRIPATAAARSVLSF